MILCLEEAIFAEKAISSSPKDDVLKYFDVVDLIDANFRRVLYLLYLSLTCKDFCTPPNISDIGNATTDTVAGLLGSTARTVVELVSWTRTGVTVAPDDRADVGLDPKALWYFATFDSNCDLAFTAFCNAAIGCGGGGGCEGGCGGGSGASAAGDDTCSLAKGNEAMGGRLRRPYLSRKAPLLFSTTS